MRGCVLILGSSSGIGLAAAQRFAREGWRVAIAAPEGEALIGVYDSLAGEGHIMLKLDVRDEAQVAAAAKRVATQFGSLAALVNSVGVSEANAVLDSDFAAWNRQFDLMLYGCVRATRAFAPLLAEGGRIVNVTSIHHERVARNYSSYAMAKAAITQFTRALALELAPKILCNCVAPGFVDTPMSRKNGANELESEWFKENYVKQDHLPLKRAARPDEIAGAIYFLCGADASYITGSVLTVDGGLTITF